MRPLHLQELINFYSDEALVLDTGRLTEWLDFLHHDIWYEIPVRREVARDQGSELSPDAYYMKETYGSLQTRVHRLVNEYAWAENPPTRTRRLVANIRAIAEPNDGIQMVTNSFATFCYKGDRSQPLVITGERRDHLHVTDDGIQLLGRRVQLDATVLALPSLSIFL